MWYKGEGGMRINWHQHRTRLKGNRAWTFSVLSHSFCYVRRGSLKNQHKLHQHSAHFSSLSHILILPPIRMSCQNCRRIWGENAILLCFHTKVPLVSLPIFQLCNSTPSFCYSQCNSPKATKTVYI